MRGNIRALFLLLLASSGVASEPLAAREQDVLEAEARAKALMRSYYLGLDSLARTGMRQHADCTAVDLQACLGGDPECIHALGYGTSAGLVCTDPRARSGRAELLEKLDALGGAAPASDWIVGQRVYLAWKNGALDHARATADGCQGSPWWCQALRGFVLHARVPGAGEAQLDSAIANAPADMHAWASPADLPWLTLPEWSSGPAAARDRGLACEWTDLSTLIRGGGHPEQPTGRHPNGRVRPSSYTPPSPEASALLAEYQNVPCGQNGAFEERFWWLADPMWSVPGNERRSEHIWRNVQRRLRDEIVLGDEAAHLAWNHRTMLPLGIPNSWTGGYQCGPCPDHVRGRSGGRVSSLRSWPHAYANGGYSFVPDARRMHDPVSSTAEDWALTWNEGRERMITPHTWHDLEHQTVVLWRGEQLLTLAAARLPVLVASLDGVRAALAMGRPSDLHVELRPARVEPTGAVRASMQLPDVGWLASLELAGEGWRGRVRRGAPGPVLVDGFGLSVPVLVDERFEGDGLPLLDAMLPTTALGAGLTRIGVYFEVYGADELEVLEVTLTTDPLRIDRSLVSRIAGALRLGARAPAALEVSWAEEVKLSTPGLMTRHLAVDLGGLEAGEYRLMVRVTRAGGAAVHSTRDIRIVR